MAAALYREYRPKTFTDVIGQDDIVKTLRNQIKTGKVLHAYLFCGTRGVGKTTFAKIFAKAINCENPVDGNPCLKCDCCKMEGDANTDIIEIDAASNNGVDKIRELRDNVKYLPFVAKKKVYIIDEVHMLSESAFNAFLKTLEEPPEHAVFILATTEANKLPATILSRCSRYNFKLASQEELTKLLKEVCKKAKIETDADSLKLISKLAEGSFRDALSILESCSGFCENNMTIDKVGKLVDSVNPEKIEELTHMLFSQNIDKVTAIIEELFAEGVSASGIIKELLETFKELAISKTLDKKAKIDLKNIELDNIIVFIKALTDLEVQTKNTLSPKLILEAGLISAMFP